MPGAFDTFVNQNKGDLQEAFGNIEDYIKQPRDYEQAQKEISAKMQDREKERKFWDISNRLQGIDYNNLPTTKAVESNELNPDHPDFVMPDKSTNPAVQNYWQYVNNLNEADEKGNKKYGDAKPVSFPEYIKMHPDLEQHIGEQHYRKRTDNVTLTPQELDMAAYKSVGLDDNDINFYNQNKNSIDKITDWNQKVQQTLLKAGSRLKPRYGKRDLSEDIMQQGQQLLLPEPKEIKHKYAFHQAGDKTLKYDEATGNYSYIDNPGKDSKKKKTAGEYKAMSYEDVMKDIPADEMGDYYSFFSKDVQGKIRNDFPEIAKEVDRTNKEGEYTPKQGKVGRRSSGPKRRKNFNDYTPEQLKNVKAGELDKMTVDELSSLKKNKKYLSDDVKEKLRTMRETDDNSGTDSKSDNFADKDKTNEGNQDSYADETDDGVADRVKEWQNYFDDIQSGKNQANWDDEKKKFWTEMDSYKKKSLISKDDYDYLSKTYY